MIDDSNTTDLPKLMRSYKLNTDLICCSWWWCCLRYYEVRSNWHLLINLVAMAYNVTLLKETPSFDGGTSSTKPTRMYIWYCLFTSFFFFGSSLITGNSKKKIESAAGFFYYYSSKSIVRCLVLHGAVRIKDILQIVQIILGNWGRRFQLVRRII